MSIAQLNHEFRHTAEHSSIFSIRFDIAHRCALCDGLMHLSCAAPDYFDEVVLRDCQSPRFAE